MTAAPRTEPGNAVARAELRAIGQLPPEIQRALELRKMKNLVTAQISGTNWGKGIDDATRRAVADWALTYGIDATTEICVLGGNVYLSAVFYLRKLSELIDAGLVEYAYADHVEDDPRLATFGPEGEGEATRRIRHRIMHAIPDKAASAVIFRVKLRSMEREVTGTKWCGNGTRKNDPVGEQFPVESAETRAARRAMRLLSTHVPQQMQDEVEAIEATAEMLSDRVTQGRAEVKQREELSRVEPKAIAAPADPADPYSVSATREREAVREPVRDVAAPDPARQAAPSLFEEPKSDAPAVAAPTTGRSKFKMPFTMGDARVATPLDLVVTTDLANAREWAMRNDAGKYSDFIEAAGIELDERRP